VKPPDIAKKVLLIAALGSFLSSVTSSIVGVILPKIASVMGVKILEAQWVMLLPLVVISSFLVPFGHAADTYGHKRIYVLGAFLGFVGALGCALAPDFLFLLLFRGVQGLGASAAMACAPALISLTVEPSKRGRYLGLASTALYIGLAAGPPIGGVIEQFLGYRAVFLLQAVFSFGLFILTMKAMPEVHKAEGRLLKTHVLCSVVFASFIALLVFAVTSPSLGFAVLALAFLAIFAKTCAQTSPPFLDTSLLKQKTIMSAIAGAFLNYCSLFSATFLLPFFLDRQFAMESSAIGIVMSVHPVTMAIVASPAGTLSDRLGSRFLSSAGMFILAGGLLCLGLFAGTVLVISGAMFLIGAGTGVFVSPNTNALLSHAPRNVQGSASAILALSRNLGMISGIALSATLSQMSSGPGADGDGMRLAWLVGAVLAFIGAFVVLTRDAVHNSNEREA
jgi:MFS family permease